MKNRTYRPLRRLLAALLCAALSWTGAASASAAAEKPSDPRAIYEATTARFQALIREKGAPDVGSSYGEWLVLALTRAGEACPEGYYDKVLAQSFNEKEQLHSRKSTENSRVILALTAAGYDVTDVGGHNLLMGLTDLDYVVWQGINGPIWALIAFDSHGYEIPANPDAAHPVTRAGLIDYLLESQLEGGGWSLTGLGSADVDVTAMALQALAPYRAEARVGAAIDAALAVLSDRQQSDGFFYSWGAKNAESCAQVIVALTALGLDPAADERFVKNGVSVLDALCAFAVEDGGFSHTLANKKYDQMASEQGQYALAAYFRFRAGQTPLYDMRDVTIRTAADASEADSSDADSSGADSSDSSTSSSPSDSSAAASTSEPAASESPTSEPESEPAPRTGDAGGAGTAAALIVLSAAGVLAVRKQSGAAAR